MSGPTRVVPPPYLVEVDLVSDSLIYKGEAPVGSATSEPAWRVQRIELTSTSVIKSWAAQARFACAWDDRATLSYA